MQLVGRARGAAGEGGGAQYGQTWWAALLSRTESGQAAATDQDAVLQAETEAQACIAALLRCRRRIRRQCEPAVVINKNTSHHTHCSFPAGLRRIALHAQTIASSSANSKVLVLVPRVPTAGRSTPRAPLLPPPCTQCCLRRFAARRPLRQTAAGADTVAAPRPPPIPGGASDAREILRLRLGERTSGYARIASLAARLPVTVIPREHSETAAACYH